MCEFLSKHNVTPNFPSFNFRFYVVFKVPTKKFIKNRESEFVKMKAIFVHCICCLTCVEKMKAIHFPRKFAWLVLTQTRSYSVFTETVATQTMKTNHMTELKQYFPTFSNPVNQMSYFQIQPIKCLEQHNEISTCLL